jgi:pimeloyl-ACP methyl ester carboxylesterase
MSQEVCNSVSLATCPAHFGPITLAEALHRFQREAVTGLCDTGRYRCPFFSWGDGPTLVCIPGLADDSKSFVQPLALLSRHFRCVAYDWPTGNDGARLSGYHHGDFVEDLFAVLDHVGAGQAFPLGYSFGSTVALAALHARPERFPRAVLLGGFARRPLAPAEELLASWARYWQGAMDRVPLRHWVLEAGQAQFFAQREPEVWAYYIQRTGSLPIGAMAWRALILHQVDLRPLLPAIHQPTLLVCGDSDPVVNKRCELELLTGLPHVMRFELPHCGHVAIYTHPEALAEAVAEFLQTGWRLLANGEPS